MVYKQSTNPTQKQLRKTQVKDQSSVTTSDDLETMLCVRFVFLFFFFFLEGETYLDFNKTLQKLMYNKEGQNTEKFF